MSLHSFVVLTGWVIIHSHLLVSGKSCSTWSLWASVVKGTGKRTSTRWHQQAQRVQKPIQPSKLVPKGHCKFTAISVSGEECWWLSPCSSMASWPFGATTPLTLAHGGNHWSTPSLWNLTVPLRGWRRALWGTLWRPEGLWAFQAVGFASAPATAWGRTVGHWVGASVHHDCVHAVGHGERLEVGLDGHREGQFVDKVHRCAGDDGTAAQILEAEDSVWPPEFLHPVPH